MIVFLILLGIIAPIVYVEPLQDPVVLPKLATTATLTGAALVWGAVLLVRDRWPGGRWPATLWVPLVAFVVVNVLAWALALDWRWSLYGERFRYQGLLTTLLYVLLFAVTAVSVRSTRDLRWLLLGVFAGGLGVAIYALIQKAGLDAFELGRSTSRPAATLGQPNAFAAYLVAVISASAFLVLSAAQHWQKAVLAAGIVVMLFALLFTVSRSGLVAMFVVLLIWFAAAVVWFVSYRLGRQPSATQLIGASAAGTALALIAVAVGSLVFVGLPQGWAGIGQAGARAGEAGDFESQSVGGRVSLWRMAIRMTADEPLLGHGHDAFTILFAEYRDRPDMAGIGTSGIEPESSHNFFLDLASGTGLLGLLAFLALAGTVLWHAARRALSTEDAAMRGALVALGTGVVGYLVAVFFGFSEGMTTWILWLLLGATAGLVARVVVDPQHEERVRRSGQPGFGSRIGDAERPRALAAGTAAVVLFMAGAAVLGWAATFVAADLASAQSTAASIRGEAVASANLAKRAAEFNPLNRNYLSQHARAEESAGFETGDRAAALRDGIDLQERLLRRFRPAASDVMALGLARYQLARIPGEDLPPTDFACPVEIGVPFDDELALFECALEMDAFSILLRSFIAEFYEREGFEDAALLHRVVIFCWRQTCD